jgi:hypothetical protein
MIRGGMRLITYDSRVTLISGASSPLWPPPMTIASQADMGPPIFD